MTRSLFERVDALDEKDGNINVQQMSFVVEKVLKRGIEAEPKLGGRLPKAPSKLALDIAKKADLADGTEDGLIDLEHFSHALDDVLRETEYPEDTPDEMRKINSTNLLDIPDEELNSLVEFFPARANSKNVKVAHRTTSAKRFFKSLRNKMRPPELVVVAIFGSFDDLAVQTSLVLGGTVPVAALLLGVFLGSMIIVSICFAANLVKPLVNLLAKIPLWSIVGCFSIYTAIETST